MCWPVGGASGEVYALTERFYGPTTAMGWSVVLASWRCEGEGRILFSFTDRFDGLGTAMGWCVLRCEGRGEDCSLFPLWQCKGRGRGGLFALCFGGSWFVGGQLGVNQGERGEALALACLEQVDTCLPY